MSLSLLQLPDPCLLAVLQCCADDQHSLFSAARAHSRLHQAAVMALRSLKARVTNQQQIDSLLLHLGRHGQHVGDINLANGCNAGSLHGGHVSLPNSNLMQLTALDLSGWGLQLQSGSGKQGVLAGRMPLKQLRFWDCGLRDGEEGLASTLPTLPGLQHLAFRWPFVFPFRKTLRFPFTVLQLLQHLTHLELDDLELQNPTNSLAQLQGLTGMRHLQLNCRQGGYIAATTLSPMRHLTHLELTVAGFEADGLAGQTQMQHLSLKGPPLWADDDLMARHSCDISGGQLGLAQLFDRVQQLPQLTYLRFFNTQQPTSCAAYAALTASSKLEGLLLSCQLPPGAWEHMLPAGRQLPHLHCLYINDMIRLSGQAATPPGTRLVSCCPELQYLGLHAFPDSLPVELEVLTQLTGLRHLGFWDPRPTQGLLLQLTHLQGSTALDYKCTVHMGGTQMSREFRCKDPGDEPVWRQVLQCCLHHSDPQLVQQATDVALAQIDLTTE